MSATLTIAAPTMPWSSNAADERRFRIISTVSIILALLLGVAMNLLRVPPPPVREASIVPPHLAQIIMERKQIEIPKVEPLPAPELPKLEEKKPEPEVPAKEVKKEEPKPEAKPEPQPAPPVPAVAEQPQARVEAARKKAASSGVLAMSDMLADLRESAPTTTSSANKPAQELVTSGQKESAKATSILVGKASMGSGGIDTSKFGRSTGKGADLGSRQVASVSSDIANQEASGGGGSGAGKAKGERSSGRSEDEIARIMQANYNAIYAIYQRALRSNPALQGKIVFKIVIDPSGAVTECSAISSELGDADLERKLTLKIKSINFGAKEVAATSVNYPMELLPN
jgi:outer membrane biosynthesis protein TonB